MDGRLKDESELTQKVSLKKCQDIDRLVKNGVCLVTFGVCKWVSRLLDSAADDERSG